MCNCVTIIERVTVASLYSLGPIGIYLAANIETRIRNVSEQYKWEFLEETAVEQATKSVVDMGVRLDANLQQPATVASLGHDPRRYYTSGIPKFDGHAVDLLRPKVR